MEHLKKFNTQEEYQEWKDGDDYVYPNVCKVGEDVVYNNFPEPFWIEALEDISVNYYYKSDKRYFNGYWSYDRVNWVKFNTSDIILRTGEKIYINDDSALSELHVSGKYNVGGSILSLVYNLDYLSYDTHNVEFFRNLFINARKVVNAKDLVLAKVLPEHKSSGDGPYANLFANCSLLQSAPKLPNVDNPTSQCFKQMFSGCKSLTTAPTIKNINTYSINYCEKMFYGCSKLSFIKFMNTNSFTKENRNMFTNWVEGVSPTGTFITSSKRTDFTRGVNGIPEGWDLYLYDEDNDRYVVKFKVNGIPYEIYTDEPRDVTWQEFINSDKNTNGFKVASTEFNNPVKFGSDYVLRNNEKVAGQRYIILNESYTIGQPTETTEE